VIDLRLGDCLNILPTIPDASVDAIITDPPYPEIAREYGRWSEAQWHELMRGVVAEVRRVLKPRGSAVFVLQPNSERVGRMRVWLWEFLVWVGKEWGVVQDAYWWNFTASPTVHSQRERGLMRPSVKTCVWLGPEDCFRDQDAVLWSQSEGSAAKDRSDRALRYSPSGYPWRDGRARSVADERGGTTPFNLIPIASMGDSSAGCTRGHCAATPLDVCDWWTRYIVPPCGVICDPFMGSGTTGEAALKHGHRYIGIEKHEPYFRLSERRLANVTPALAFA
jgi:DNA modification methylase